MLYNVIQPKVAHTQLTHNTWKTVDDTRVSPTCLRCRKARRILPENVFGGQHSTEELEHFSHAEFCYMLPTFSRNLSFLRPHGRHGSHCYSRGVLQNYRRTVWIDVIDESFPHRLVVHRSLRIAASETLVLQKKYPGGTILCAAFREEHSSTWKLSERYTRTHRSPVPAEPRAFETR